MADHPILFSAPMVRAILAGTKTQTRRAIKLKPWHTVEERDDGQQWPWMHDGERDADYWLPCPYGQPGDRLWVREAWAAPHKYDGHQPAHIPALTRWHYAASEERGGLRWRPSIHMPRAASRITLEVTGVRVERLQDISESDALAEGVTDQQSIVLRADGSEIRGPVAEYAVLWEQINGPGAWDANPWVWVVEFRRVEVDRG